MREIYRLPLQGPSFLGGSKMSFPNEQIEELDRVFGEGIRKIEAMGLTFFLIPSVDLGESSQPRNVKALLCPCAKDGYPSRLYLSQKVSLPAPRNWNGNVWIEGQSWHAVSWRLNNHEHSLTQLVVAHLGAFR